MYAHCSFQENSFSTLKGELIPSIVKKQLSRPSAHSVDGDRALSIVNVNPKSDDIFHFVSQTELDKKIIETSLFNDSVNRKPYNDDVIRCYVVNSEPECFGIRINTILSYCAANQKVGPLHFKHFVASLNRVHS